MVGRRRVVCTLRRRSPFPLHWRGRGKAGLLRQRQVRGLIHWPRLLHIVIDGRLPLTNGQPRLALTLPLAASNGAVDEASPREERSAKQGGVAVLARETGVGGMPVLPLVAHLPCKKNGNISRSSAFVCFISGRGGKRPGVPWVGRNYTVQLIQFFFTLRLSRSPQ